MSDSSCRSRGKHQLGASLQFVGATGSVTGSSFLLECAGKRYLVDCGMYQERHLRKRNWDAFPIPAATIDGLFLTHAHLDHCGLIPKLVREGFSGPIYCTPPTADIAKIILFDAAHIQEEDAAFKRKRHEREGRKGRYPEAALYTEKDVKQALPLFQPMDYEQLVVDADGIRAQLYDAGHILGSAIVAFRLSCSDRQKVVVFSGDLGHWNKPIMRDPTLLHRGDAIVMESTYGDRVHEESASVKKKLADAINRTVAGGGNIIIPSFAVERTQELLYYLSELLREGTIPHLMTFVDSPMAVSVTKVFEEYPGYFDREALERIHSGDLPFYFETLRLTRTTAESKAINHIRASCIIIAGSGMCTGGRIKHHLVNNISRAQNTILFIGYQAHGTLGRHIVDGAKRVRIHGQNHPVHACVEQIHGFSAHADQTELLKWYSAFEDGARNLYLVHGESKVQAILANAVRDRTTTLPVIPDYMQKVSL